MVEELQKKYLQECGEIKPREMVTDFIPNGVTVLYGAAGVGKTESLVKHLNKNKIKPLLIDFDGNEKLYVDGKCNLVGGSWFIQNSRKNYEKIIKDKQDATNSIDKIIMDFAKKSSTEYKDAIFEKYKRNNYKEFIQNKLGSLEEDDIEFFNDCMSVLSKKENIYEIFGVSDEVVIIDTYAYCIPHFEDNLNFHRFVNKLASGNKAVIVVSHETGERGSEPEVDPVFANHAQAKLRLRLSLTKTKNEESYLMVEKLRGYNGNRIVENWER